MPNFNKNDVYCTECGNCDNIRLNLVGYADGFVDVNCSCVDCGAEWIFVKERKEKDEGDKA